jgi:hypothetical protein
MLNSSPTSVPVTAEEAKQAYPRLCAYAALVLRSNFIPGAESLLEALDANDPAAGAKLSSFEQNYDRDLPDELDDHWRVLCAYSSVMTGAPDRNASQIMPWMADACTYIASLPQRMKHA